MEQPKNFHFNLKRFLSSYQKDSSLGVAKKTREYDIPLHKKMGSEFLVLLIGLMTFLAVLALCGSFVLSDITKRWTSGLKNQLTIEIPAEAESGEIHSLSHLMSLAVHISDEIKELKAVKSVSPLGEADIKDMLSPWLGDNLNYDDIPLPALISVELNNHDQKFIQDIEKRAKAIYKTARVNTHKQWLNDIVQFTDTLNVTALLITLVIGFTTFAAVAGAMKSRVATHYDELELLHLMGASDRYISKQFQRHAFMISMKGSLFGFIMAGILLYALSRLAFNIDTQLLPDVNFGIIEYCCLCMIPIVIGIISQLTARSVALKELSTMP